MNHDHHITIAVRDFLVELVEHRDKLRVTETRVGKTLAIAIDSAPSDVGRLIGDKGSHFKALATIIAAAGHRQNMKASLLRIDDRGRTIAGERTNGFTPNPDWPRERLFNAISGLAEQVFGTIQLVAVDASTDTTLLQIGLTDEESSDRLLLLDSTFATLVLAVGRSNGRIIKASVEAYE